MKPRIVGTVLGVVVGCLAAWTDLPFVAKAQSQPQWYSINVVNVKPEKVTEWIALQRDETIPALQKIGVRERAGWVSVFGDGFEYFFAQPIGKMAERDNPQGPFVRALGQEGARVYNAKVRTMIASTRALAIQVLPDLSVMPPATFTPTLGVLTFSYVAPGRSADYETYLKTDLLPAIKKAQPVGYVQSRTVFGGDAGEYVSLRYIDNFAEIDAGPLLTRAVGAAQAAQINARMAGLVTRQERRIFRYVPDLSFRTKMTSSMP